MNKILTNLIFKNFYNFNFINIGENLYKNNIIINKIIFFKSFGSFLKVKNFNFNILIKNSKFKKFLNSCNIFLNSSIYYESLFIQENLIFDSITSTNGAGIFFNSPATHIIKNCNFLNCRVSENGGGIFSKSENFECNNCCFFLCCQGLTTQYGASIYVNSNGNHSVSSIYSLMCPSINESPWHDQISLNFGYYYESFFA